jgi:hypothetical protein
MAELEHPVHGEQAEDAQSAGGPPDTDALRDGQVEKLRDSQVTEAELLALASEVERLEAALGAAQWAAERSASEAASALAESEALRARLSEAHEQAEDDKAEVRCSCMLLTAAIAHHVYQSMSVQASVGFQSASKPFPTGCIGSMHCQTV